VLPTALALSAPIAPDVLSSREGLVALYERVNPGVVSIGVLTSDGGGQGSGFVIDMEGHIVTNYHVVAGETDLEIDFPSGFKVRGEVIGTDLDSDLAIIKVDAPADELHPLPLGDSDQVKVGQTVVAIGNPFGLNGTMTVGIVSGLGRTLASLRVAPTGSNFFTAAGIIQTDAAINPGNSGGPLLNLNGEVIGINRAIRTDATNDVGQPTNTGVGFAICSNIVRRVVPGLISEGHYDYPYLGITSLSELSLLQQEALDLPQSTGAYVTSITRGSPAEEAGLIGDRASASDITLRGGGDLIIAVDGRPVRTFNDLIEYLFMNKSPGDNIQLTVLRNGVETYVDLTLGRRP
jgi:2-alkenal reductase